MSELPVPSQRAQILALENYIRSLPDALPAEAFRTEHLFADGTYTRTMWSPAGMVLIGKIHKQRHVCFLLAGKVTIVSATGEPPVTIEAPQRWIAEPGTKRAVIVHEAMEWTVVHGTNAKTVEEVEAEVIAKDFDEADAAISQRTDAELMQRVAECLGMQ